MALKQVIRIAIRHFIGARPEEPIRDAIRRREIDRGKRRDSFVYDSQDILHALRWMGVTQGDILIVHCAWRSLYNYKDGTPESLIKVLRMAIGPEGTLVMPSYGFEKNVFDLKNTPSNAGVLSEVFRRLPGVIRSEIPHFALAAAGPAAQEIFCESLDCKYGFDSHSPYRKAAQMGAKVLLVGLGGRTAKISAFHLAGWDARGRIARYANVWGEEKTCRVVREDGSSVERAYYPKRPGVRNNNRVFREIFKAVPKQCTCLGRMDLTLFSAFEAEEVCLEEIEHGKSLYKGI